MIPRPTACRTPIWRSLLVAVVAVGMQTARAQTKQSAAGAPGPAVSSALPGALAPGAGAGQSSGMLGYTATAPSYDTGSTSSSSSTSSTPVIEGGSADDVSSIPETAIAADMLIEGPDMWPFTEDKQKILADSVQYYVLYGLGYVTITGTREAPSTSSPSRQLLEVNSSRAIATVQIDCGTGNIVQQAKSDLVAFTDPKNNVILDDANQKGLKATNLSVLNTEQIVPLIPSTTSKWEYVALGVGVAVLVGMFFGSLIWLEVEKNIFLAASNKQRPDPMHYQKMRNQELPTLKGLSDPAYTGKTDNSKFADPGFEGKTKDEGYGDLQMADTTWEKGLRSGPHSQNSLRTPQEHKGVLRLWNSDLQERMAEDRGAASV